MALPNGTSGTTAEGGTITLGTDGLSYRPKAGFTGTDHFNYLVQGALGGTNQAMVTVAVQTDAFKDATAVNWVAKVLAGLWFDSGEPNKDYLLESSQDLLSWLEVRTVTIDAAGFATFPFEPTVDAKHLFFERAASPESKRRFKPRHFLKARLASGLHFAHAFRGQSQA